MQKQTRYSDDLVHSILFHCVYSVRSETIANKCNALVFRAKCLAKKKNSTLLILKSESYRMSTNRKISQLFLHRAHRTHTPSRRKTNWNVLPSPIVKHMEKMHYYEMQPKNNYCILLYVFCCSLFEIYERA